MSATTCHKECGYLNVKARVVVFLNGRRWKFSITQESRDLSRLIKNNYTNVAQLKDLMTIPPMSAEQHAAVMRKRIEHRRMIEEAKEMKSAINTGLQFR